MERAHPCGNFLSGFDASHLLQLSTNRFLRVNGKQPLWSFAFRFVPKSGPTSHCMRDWTHPRFLIVPKGAISLQIKTTHLGLKLQCEQCCRKKPFRVKRHYHKKPYNYSYIRMLRDHRFGKTKSSFHPIPFPSFSTWKGFWYAKLLRRGETCVWLLLAKISSFWTPFTISSNHVSCSFLANLLVYHLLRFCLTDIFLSNFNL